MRIPSIKKSREDGDLLRRCASGDDDAFAVLYRRHLNAVLAFLRPRVSDPEMAFDLAAETFATVALNARSYRGDGPVAGWIIGIARNHLLHSVRRKAVEERARAALKLTPCHLDDDDLRRVEERADAGRADLHAALAQLTPETRAALLSRVVEEQPYANIATDLACSEQVVRQRVHRGLRQLRSAMED